MEEKKEQNTKAEKSEKLLERDKHKADKAMKKQKAKEAALKKKQEEAKALEEGNTAQKQPKKNKKAKEDGKLPENTNTIKEETTKKEEQKKSMPADIKQVSSEEFAKPKDCKENAIPQNETPEKATAVAPCSRLDARSESSIPSANDIAKSKLTHKSTQTGEMVRANQVFKLNNNRQDQFAHIPAYFSKNISTVFDGMKKKNITIYPSFYETVAKISLLKGNDTNIKALQILYALKNVISEASPPPINKIFREYIKDIVQNCSDLLNEYRQNSIDTISNIFKYAINAVGKLPFECDEQKAKKWLIEKLDEFVNNKIIIAVKVIAENYSNLIMENDILLTYGSSNIIEKIFSKAHKKGIHFKVIVAQGRPDQEASFMANRLSKKGIDCTFTLITGVPYMLKGVKKILVGASAMLSNGCLVHTIGTATVACIAKTFHIPFIVCCEYYKFLDEVLLNSITKNELGNPKDLVCPVKYEEDAKYSSKVVLLNPLYDVTPSNFISLLISEVGRIPPTSVPIVIREFKEDMVYEG